ncbi:MAG: trypsin-like peptidase domain-containing protein [Candidatus Eremiobacteraeota bacterium]|nr:trypsin-like peptidase domain-containing protein [Candidatus Eremiobacteraeota bacterium]
MKRFILTLLLLTLPCQAQQHLAGLLAQSEAIVEVVCQHQAANGNRFATHHPGVVVDPRGLVMMPGRLDQQGPVTTVSVQLFRDGRPLPELPAQLLFYDRASQHSFVRVGSATPLPAVTFSDQLPDTGDYVYSLARVRASHQNLQPVVVRRAFVESAAGLSAEGHRAIDRQLSGLVFDQTGSVVGLFKASPQDLATAGSFVPAEHLQRVIGKAIAAAF